MFTLKHYSDANNDQSSYSVYEATEYSVHPNSLCQATGPDGTSISYNPVAQQGPVQEIRNFSVLTPEVVYVTNSSGKTVDTIRGPVLSPNVPVGRGYVSAR